MAFTPPFLRKRTSSTSSHKTSSSSLGFRFTSSSTAAADDPAFGFTTTPKDSPTTPSRASFLSSSSVSTAKATPLPVSTAQLFGGAPLLTSTSPVYSDRDPDFGSSYEGPGAFNNNLSPSSISSQDSVSPYNPTKPLPSIQRQLHDPGLKAQQDSISIDRMKPAYHAANAHEGAWLGGAADADASRNGGLSPHTAAPAQFGTSPGNQSDLSNEAQIHGNSDAHSDLSSSVPYETQGSSHLYTNAVNMSGLEPSDSRPSMQSLQNDTHNSFAGPSVSTPTLAEQAAYQDARGYINPHSSVDTGSNPRMSNSMAPSQLTSSSSFADSSSHTLYNNNASSNVVHQPPSLNMSGSHLSASASGPTMEDIVPTSFDEGVLRSLCDIDCGMPLLFDRIKQSMVSAREAAAFLKKRATIEEEYARSMAKLSRSTLETYSLSDAKAGSYVKSWHGMMKTHEMLADNRLRFAAKLNEMSDELGNLAKEVDKSRKQAKETGSRLEKNLQDAESGVEKARARFDTAAEDLERLLLLKSGESTKSGEMQSQPGSGKRTLGKAIGKSGLLFKNKNPQQILKQEEDIRAKTSTASDAFRKEVLSTQGIRQEYFNLQLPRILRTLKENAEEIDNGTQYHLARYAFLFESTVLSDGMAISPVGTDIPAGSGLKGAVETIDNRADFKQYMANYQVAHGRDYRGPRREGPYEEGFVQGPGSSLNKSMPATPTVASARPIFGIDLTEQMTRDNVEVPPILEKCAHAIEQVGIENMGIYRLSGTTSKVQKLKSKFDADWAAVDLMNDEAIQDINIVAGCLKLWFRELPEPLLTHELYAGFIEAAKIENDRLRHIRLHERVNELPDANYATLKYLMGHLDKVKSMEHVNQMSASNLAIVFGPTLLSPPPAGYEQDVNSNTPSNGGLQIHDMSFQCRAVETILDKYREIFVDEGE